MNEFIVGEISKNWPEEDQALEGQTIAQLFEDVIAFNLRRGYLLHSFDLNQLAIPGQPPRMVETIIAVFRRMG